MARLEGEKTNAGAWIVGLVLVIAVATILYFVFVPPREPVSNTAEPAPGLAPPPETVPTSTPVPTRAGTDSVPAENGAAGNGAAEMPSTPDVTNAPPRMSTPLPVSPAPAL